MLSLFHEAAAAAVAEELLWPKRKGARVEWGGRSFRTNILVIVLNDQERICGLLVGVGDRKSVAADQRRFDGHLSQNDIYW